MGRAILIWALAHTRGQMTYHERRSLRALASIRKGPLRVAASLLDRMVRCLGHCCPKSVNQDVIVRITREHEESFASLRNPTCLMPHYDNRNPYRPPSITEDASRKTASDVPRGPKRYGYIWAYFWYPIAFVAIPAIPWNSFYHAPMACINLAAVWCVINTAVRRRSGWIAITAVPGVILLYGPLAGVCQHLWSP